MSNACRQFNDQLTDTLSAMVLLNSSCQGIVETYINPPSSSPDWYDTINSKLDAAQKLVRDWRLSGNLYFNRDIVSRTIASAQSIVSEKAQIEELFRQLSDKYDEALKTRLVTMIGGTKPLLDELNAPIAAYSSQIESWGAKMENAHEDLNQTVSDIQAREVKIQDEILQINQQITTMQAQIKTYREAIAKAKSAEKRGIFETIFGVLFAPLTGGLSLILAGIGVSSIVEAEDKVSDLQGVIQNNKTTIAAYQNDMSDDAKAVSSLKILLSSVQPAIDDCSEIASALDSLQTTIESLSQEIDDAIAKLNKATSASEIIMEKVWYEAFYNEWSDILDETMALKDASPDTKRINL